MLTGQFPSTHGAWMNGVPLAIDAPSVAEELHDAGYATALNRQGPLRTVHGPVRPLRRERPRRLGVPTIEQDWFDGRRGVHRGFDYLEFATHGVDGLRCTTPSGCATNIPRRFAASTKWSTVTSTSTPPAAATPARPQVKYNAVPREWYHTDWVADRTIRWLEAQDADGDWFCWMSFPDPTTRGTRPPPSSAASPWRDVPLPGELSRATPASASRCSTRRPVTGAHGTTGRLVSNYEAPAKWVPATMTADQVREVNALNAVEVELIDEAIGRVLAEYRRQGLGRGRRRHLHQ